MPEICKFFGIIISLYWRDHHPPHIHLSYGEYECSISVLDRIVDGKAPSKVIAKVNEWMDLHEAEILTLWEKTRKYTIEWANGADLAPEFLHDIGVVA